MSVADSRVLEAVFQGHTLLQAYAQVGRYPLS